MPFLVFDEIEKETVTPKYSTAYGELVIREYIEVGRLNFKAGEGAVEHAHPHEQVMYIISGKLAVDLEGEHAELGPGMGFHAKPNQKHRCRRSRTTQVLSTKHVIEGRRAQDLSTPSTRPDPASAGTGASPRDVRLPRGRPPNSSSPASPAPW